MTEFLPPIVLPIEGELRDLAAAIAESKALIRAFVTAARQTLKEGGEDGGREFAQGLRRGIAAGLARDLAAGFTQVAGQGLLRAFLPFGPMGTAITGLIFGAGQAVAALTPVVGVLNLIPAAATAAALTITTLHMAFKGIGTALSAGSAGDMAKYAEALSHLAPAARAAVREMLALKPAMDAVRADVQQGFWSQLTGQIKLLGEQYIPLLRSELSAMSVALGSTVRNVLDLANRSEYFFQNMYDMMTNTVIATRNAAPALAHIINAFAEAGAVGSRFLPGLAAGFATLTERFDHFIARAAESGELEQWIRGGLDALRMFGGLLKDAWNVLSPIITALNATNSAGGFGFLGQLLKDLGEFLNSAQGAQTLTATFTILGDVFGWLSDTLITLLPALGAAATALVPIADAIASIEPDVMAQLAESLTQMVVAATPAIPVFAELVTELLPALIPLIKLFGDVVAFTLPGSLLLSQALLNLVHGYQLLGDQLDKVGPLLRTVGGWFAALPGRILGFLTGLPSRVAHFGRQMMLGLVYEVGAGAGLIVKGFLTLVQIVPRVVADLWHQVTARTAEGVNSSVAWWKSLPERALAFALKLRDGVHDFFADAGHWLYGAGVDMVKGLINGVGDMWSHAVDFVKDLGHSLVSGFADAVGWHSPAAAFVPGGASIVLGLMKGVQDNAGALRSLVGGLFGRGGVGGPRLALAGAGGGRGGGGAAPPISVKLYLDTKQVLEAIIPTAQRRKQRTGSTGLT